MADRFTTNLYMGGAPAMYQSKYDADYNHSTAEALRTTCVATAQTRKDMHHQGQITHFELGAVPSDYHTSGAQPDHISNMSEEDKRMAAQEKGTLKLNKQNMQSKHFELGLSEPEFKSEAAAHFTFDRQQFIATSSGAKAERDSRGKEGRLTHYELGADPAPKLSETASAYTAPPAKAAEGENPDMAKMPPPSRLTSLTVGLTPVDYTSETRATELRMLQVQAETGERTRTHGRPKDAGRTNWDLGGDDNKTAGYYVSQTAATIWKEPVPAEATGASRRLQQTTHAAAATAPLDDSFAAGLATMIPKRK